MIIEQNPITIKQEANRIAKDSYISLLKEGRSVYINAWGGSMHPFIKNGDRLKLEPVNNKGINIGDIVAVEIKNQAGAWFLVHRVVKVTQNSGDRFYFTKGDRHLEGLDNPITRELIVGKVTQIYRKGLKINLELPIWLYFNKLIAKLSLSHPKLLIFLSRYINLMIIERRVLLSKIKNRVKKGNPFLCNSEELLVLCARKSLNEALKKKAIELIREGLSWNRFLQAARTGGVSILVNNSLREIANEVRIPEFVFRELKEDCLLITSGAIKRHSELVAILKSFAEEGIPIVPLKGTLLSKRLYQDIAIRGLSSDIDLLVEEKNKEKARILLERYGYTFVPEDEIKELRWHSAFLKKDEIRLELHWDISITGRSKERIEGLWHAARVKEEEGVAYYGLREEELLLYLCVHLVNSDCFRHLRYVCDINELLDRYKDTLDWECVIEKAKQWKILSSVYAALRLSQDIFKSYIPSGVLNKLKPNFLKLIIIKIFTNKKNILQNTFRRYLINGFLSYFFFDLIEGRSIKDYSSIFKRVFFPAKEIIRNKNPILRIFNGLSQISLDLFKKKL